MRGREEGRKEENKGGRNEWSEAMVSGREEGRKEEKEGGRKEWSEAMVRGREEGRKRRKKSVLRGIRSRKERKGGRV